jgi:hypothetical protein
LNRVVGLLLASIVCFAGTSGPDKFQEGIKAFCQNLKTCGMVPQPKSGMPNNAADSAKVCEQWLENYLSDYNAFPRLRNDLTNCIESINKRACKAFSQNAIQTPECVAYDKKLAAEKKLPGN